MSLEDKFRAALIEMIESDNKDIVDRIVYRLANEIKDCDEDKARLDFLDGNLKFSAGWRVAIAPVGLISVWGIGRSQRSIRDAIDRARKGDKT